MVPTTGSPDGGVTNTHAKPGFLDRLVAGLDDLLVPVGAVAGVSLLMNGLTLTGPLFMLQVYDRVLPSRSVPTLVGLSIFALVAFGFLCGLDILRGRLLGRISRAFDDAVSPTVFAATLLQRRRRPSGDGSQPLRDLDTVRSFMGSSGLAAIFDLPWLPVYLIVCFLFHPMLGWSVLLGVMVLSIVTFAGDRLTRRNATRIAELATSRRTVGETTIRNAELVSALGLARRMGDLWVARNVAYLDQQGWASDLAQALAGSSRTARTVLQSAVLAVGAWLVIRNEATAGVMLAATILATRALSPVDLVIASWPHLVEARLAWARLDDLLRAHPPEPARTPLPRACQSLTVTSLGVVAPGTDRLLLADVSLDLKPGNALAVLGPSGSGKSTLARTLVGSWTASRGIVRIDGAALEQWDPEALGHAIGYMPQDSVLLDGTVAENISRFAAEPDPDALIRAAQNAGVHDLVLRLPSGYETQVGDGGTVLSGGQRQRIALARALYGEPFLLVLDEPNSNLDAEGEQALATAIARVRLRGGIVVVVAHRASILAAVDRVLVLNGGRVHALGPRDEILRQLNRPATARPAPAGANGPSEESARGNGREGEAEDGTANVVATPNGRKGKRRAQG